MGSSAGSAPSHSGRTGETTGPARERGTVGKRVDGGGSDPWDASRSAMVAALSRREPVVSERVLDAMERVPRHRFLTDENRAYVDSAVEIGHGQTISAPHMVAIMCDLLDPRPGEEVLEVGTGSGYHAAVLAELVRPRGHVWTVEHVPALAESAARVLDEVGYDDVHVAAGDGALGFPAPPLEVQDRGAATPPATYTRISIAAACPAIPSPLIERLAPGGRLIAPVATGVRESGDADLTIIERREDGGLEERVALPCRFVPLRGAYGR